MMNLHGRLFASLVCLFLLAAGCDKSKPQSPPPTASDAPPPTTQEILAGPRVAQQLTPYPFTLNLPSSWTVKGPHGSDDVGVTQIYDSSPTGDNIQIEITRLGNIALPMRLIDEKAAELSQRQTKEPQVVLKVAVSPFAGGKILESRTLTHLNAASATRPGDQAHAAADFVEWEITIMIPHPDRHSTTPKFDQYLLSVSDLTPDQYQRDQKFLEELLGSLKYNSLSVP